jgi:hypothetical protein
LCARDIKGIGKTTPNGELRGGGRNGGIMLFFESTRERYWGIRERERENESESAAVEGKGMELSFIVVI